MLGKKIEYIIPISIKRIPVITSSLLNFYGPTVATNVDSSCDLSFIFLLQFTLRSRLVI